MVEITKKVIEDTYTEGSMSLSKKKTVTFYKDGSTITDVTYSMKKGGTDIFKDLSEPDMFRMIRLLNGAK